MKPSSITEQYVMALFGTNAAMRYFSTRHAAGVVSLALHELEDAQTITISNPDSKRLGTIDVAQPLPSELHSLRSIVSYLKAHPGIPTTAALRNTTVLSAGREVGRLTDDIIGSLIAQDLGTAGPKKWFTRHQGFTPHAAALSTIIDALKAEIDEPGPITRESAALGVAMQASKISAYYFSQFEQQLLAERLHTLRSTPEGKRIEQLEQHVENVMELFLVLMP